MRDPEQVDRWSWLVLLAYTQLRLAHLVIADQRLPWEYPLDTRPLTHWLGAARLLRRAAVARGHPAIPPKLFG